MTSRRFASRAAADHALTTFSPEAIGKAQGKHTQRKEDEPRVERDHKPPESRMNRIAERAHEIYEARGGEYGKALADWLQAEREIDDETR